MNGDEFAVLIEGAGSDQIATRAAQRCKRAAAEAFEFDGQKINLSLSIGLVTKTSNYRSPDDVLRDADMALSRCKEQGGGLIEFFDQKMLEEAIESLQLENDLRLALQNHEFVLHYQPIVRLKDMRTIGLEALIRWNHPEQGTIYPAGFIPKAKKIGLIHDIDNWVLNEGCRQYNRWQQTIPSFKNLSLSVNISSHQFGQAGFADKVARIIADNALNPSVLKFEITESVLMEKSGALIEKLAAIKDIGVKLVLDDFGAGYSPFSYLHQLPLDELKIGKSIIQNLDFNSESYEIVKSIVALAKKFGLKVLAEGVETEAHYNRVKSLDFDMVQGFWFGQSVNEREMFRCLQKLNKGN
jgi:EAL domain-containing protein (putative c-di-GMP-specific phosphodiesterase class I)